MHCHSVRPSDPSVIRLPNPQQIPMLWTKKVSQVACGDRHVILVAEGLVYAMGNGTGCALGQPMADSYVPIPVNLGE